MPSTTCCFAMCKTSYKKSRLDGKKIRFFYFPSDPLTRKAWIKNCRGIADYNIKYKRVCSLHFKISDFEDEIQARILNYPPKKLKKNAVPSLITTSSALETSSAPATSDREKQYSEKLRKKVVEECLAQHKPIVISLKSKLSVPIKGNDKVSDKNSKKIVNSPVESTNYASEKNISKEVTISIDESNKVSDKHREEEVNVPIEESIEIGDKNTEKKVNVPIGESIEIGDKNTEKEVNVPIEESIEIGDKNTEKEVNVPIEESTEISDKNTETGVGAAITGENNIIDQNTTVVVVTVPIITTIPILQNANEDCVCGVSQNCFKCHLRTLKEENDALKSRIKVYVQNERDLKHTNNLAKKRFRAMDAEFESKVKTAFQHFLTPNQVEAVLRKKMKARWTDEDISKAFNIMQFSKRFYIYLKNTLNYPLPSLSTVRKWVLDTSLKFEKDCSVEMVEDPSTNLESLPSECAMHSENLSSDHPMEYETSDNPTHSENLPTDHPSFGYENSTPEKESCAESSNTSGRQIKTLYFPSDSNTDPENLLQKKTSTVSNKTFKFHVSHKNYFSKLILKRHRRKVVKPKRFTCSVCQKGFDLNGALKRHFKTHVLANPWTCDVCDDIFSSKYHLDKHVTTHKNAEKFLCDICDQSFVKKVNFQDHYLKHKNIQPHNVCNKEINIDQGTSKEQCGADLFLATHFPTQTEDKPYLCHICNELFENKSDLRIHLVVCIAESKSAKDSSLTKHKNSPNKCTPKRHRSKVVKPKRFTCPICQKGFNLHGAFKIHSKMHVLENPLTCDVCDEIFSSKCHLNKHVTTHKNAEKFVCDICDQSFVSRANFQYHYFKHKNIQPQDVCNKELSMDQCIIEGTSNEQYGTDQFVVTHYSTQTMPYLCHICSTVYETKSDLKIHLVVCKSESKSFAKDDSLRKATYVCEFCNRGFRFHHFFQNHLLMHKNRQMIGNKFVCEICDKMFAKQTSLHRHRILHDGSRNQVQFFCNVCNKGFRQKRYLNQHLQTHADEKPYACMFCSKRFTQNSTLKKHCETHKNEGYPGLTDLYA